MLWRALLVFGWTAALSGACTRLEVVDNRPNAPLGEGGAAGEGRGGFGSVAGEAVAGDGGAGVTPGGAPGAASFGLWPTYAAPPQESEVAAVLAAVSALSAGSRSLPLHERWDELSGATGSPRAVTWRRLDAMVAPYREREGKVAFCIDVVDRAQPAWPFSGELDQQAARDALLSTINEVFSRYASHLSLLCFGYQLDRYLAHAEPAQQAALLDLLTYGVSVANSHPQRSRERTAIGVALSLESLVGEPPELSQLGDAVVAVYDALDADGELKPPESSAEEVDQLVQALAEREPEPRPIVLLEAGYPSAKAAGSSEKAQRDHVTSLLAALDRSGGAVKSVFLNGLSDRSADACVTEARSFYPPSGEGEPDAPDAPDADEDALAEAVTARAVARCSMGLRAENASPKLAWAPAVRALLRE